MATTKTENQIYVKFQLEINTKLLMVAIAITIKKYLPDKIQEQNQFYSAGL